MITTVIVWPQPLLTDVTENIENLDVEDWFLNNQNPTPLQIQDLKEMANTISPEFAQNFSVFMNENRTLRTSVRVWPDVEAAQTWITYVLENYNVVSADIHQGILDPEEARQYGTLTNRY